MSGGGPQTNHGASDQVAAAIRKMVQPNDGRLLRTALLITLTENADGTDQQPDVHYPFGVPDRAMELAMLRRAIDRLRD